MTGPEQEADVKEWVRCSHTAQNKTSVTVTLQCENVTAKWAVSCYSNQLKGGVAEARTGAKRALRELQEALAE